MTIMKRKRRSYYVPEEIKRAILVRLPVKSVLRFRSVDKRFRRLISTQQFIADHLKAFRFEEDKLILLGKGRPKQLSCCLFLDGLIPTHIEDIRLSYENLSYNKVRMVGYCNGVVCLICRSNIRSTCELLFVNPIIKKVVAIPASEHLSGDISSPIFGFGYSEDDYKLVVFPNTSKTGASLTANVFSLKARNWETLVCSWSEPQDPKHQYWKITSKRPVFVDGAFHWLAKDFDVNGMSTIFVLSFHLSGDHKIGKIALPKFLCITIHVYDGRLAVIVRDELWLLNRCGSNWTRILKRVILRGPRTILGFSGGGSVVFRQKNMLIDCACGELFCYNPRTQRKSLLKTNHGDEILSLVRLYAYKQTLALLE